MKHLHPNRLLVVATAIGLFTQTLQSALFMEDAITNAAPGANIGLTTPWGSSSPQVKVAAGNLTSTTLQALTPEGNMLYVLGTGGGSSYRPFSESAVANGAIYYSFLVNCTNPPTGNAYLTGLLPAGTTSPGGSSDPLAVYFAANGNGFQLAIRKSGATTVTSPTVLTTNTVHFIVAKYTFGAAAGDDVVSLFINPSPGVAEPAANLTQTGGTDAANLQNLYMKSSSGYGSWLLDTLRVGSSWADVTPSSGITPPSVTNNPVITQAVFNGVGIVLRGTNGLSNGVYQVLSSSAITTPRASWPSIATNLFDSSGNFDCTNPVAPTDVSRFYTLLVGGQIPLPPQGPVITTQPTNRAGILGQSASFNVFASGDPTLYYQWYFNTNTLLTDKTNALLSLSGITTNDAGYYSVVVSNSVNSVVSTQALLSVIVPPLITADPTNLTVLAGDSAGFAAAASGSAPLAYQWFFNTNTPLANATNATLLITDAKSVNEGTYSLRATNLAGSVTSLPATLTVIAGPSIGNQPQDVPVTVSNNAMFTVVALGTPSLTYQWYFNTNTLLLGATNFSLTITNAQLTNAGGYSVLITNFYGSITSRVAKLTVNTNTLSASDFSLYGFAQATTGGGVITEGSAGWVKVTNAQDFALAISNKTGTIKVIEIMNDLDLGYNEVGPAVQAFSIFREHATPKLHPRLLLTGVSIIDIQNKDGLTIFSANGAAIRHANLNIKSSANIILRNLKFDELWEWDEATKGDYDANDWDFITLGNGGGTVSNIWIDHCTFTKAYDGICDMKGGCFNITYSWNKYVGDDGLTNTNSFVWQQISSLESNTTSYPMYNFLRTHGFSMEDVVTISQGHDKTHLIGATSLNSENAQHAVTFHHQWYMNPWDRLPRLRAGNAHNYNIYVDDTQGLAAKRLRNAIVSAMSPTDQAVLNGTPTKDPVYKFNPFLNGTISTEDGAILVENSVYIDCLTPLRNNQTDPSDPTYTGKILALDSIYRFDNTNGTTTVYQGSSTNAPGDTYFGPVQAPTKPFSWNLPGNVLPYSYTLDDPNQLETIVSNYTGAGVIIWSKTNWLKTAYSP